MIFYRAHAEVKPAQRELYFPSFPFQKVWNSFFPRQMSRNLGTAYFTQNNGAEQVGMCVLGEAGKGDIALHKRILPRPRAV